jgi:TatD DNase family protein
LFVHPGQAVEARPLFKEDLEELASDVAAMPGTFEGCVHVCCELEGIDAAVSLVKWGREVLGGKVFVCFGIHPTNFHEYNAAETEAKLAEAIAECGPQVVAWGECGLDYYRRYDAEERTADELNALRARMKDVFARQSAHAVERGLPLVVHSRDAEADTLEVLRTCVPREHRVFLHSFMGSVATTNQFLEQWPNSFVGIVGALSYEGVGRETPGGLHDIARALPLDRILLETDGPYMAPCPYRGEEAHFGHIPWIAHAIAEAKGIGVADVLTITYQNFRKMYSL